jgi:hypothetical protein
LLRSIPRAAFFGNKTDPSILEFGLRNSECKKTEPRIKAETSHLTPTLSPINGGEGERAEAGIQ